MPPGTKRYLICSRRVDDTTRPRLNCAIKGYLQDRPVDSFLTMGAAP
jgi:hypothetical protein